MNHLAHVALSGPQLEVIMGNLVTDYLRKSESLELPVSIQQGVRLHRFIDHSMDNMPEVRACWLFLYADHGKYASVIFDIYCDYLLSRHWTAFHRDSHRFVADRAYEALRLYGHFLPENLYQRFQNMMATDWLMRYGSYEGQSEVFDRLRKRVSRPELLEGVLDSLRKHEEVFTDAFRTFYPKLQKAAADEISLIDLSLT